jgi:processive 1,2-diacylglycerol beta-glucosyltransferase
MIALNKSWVAPNRPTSGAPRILILSASVGNGHLRAAEAIEAAARSLLPDAVIRNEDALALATAPLRFSYANCYLHLIEKAPLFVGYLYGRMDQPKKVVDSWLGRLKVFLERTNLRPLVHLLTDEPWDLVINTFFLSTEIVASLRRLGRISAPQVQVVTDFETHRNWVNSPCELYCTATEESALYLEVLGVPTGRSVVTGIPIHPEFGKVRDRADCLNRQGLVGDRPIVLLLGGGHGVGPMEEIYQALQQVKRPLEIVVVAGWNEAARAHLQELAGQSPVHRCHILGYTDQIPDLMAAADLVVTKPGGLTVAEALASGVGLVLVHPVPGQEERNSDYLLENGAAIKINHIPTMAHKLQQLLADPAHLAALRSNARRLARPRSAFEVVEHSLKLIPGPNRDGRTDLNPRGGTAHESLAILPANRR